MANFEIQYGESSCKDLTPGQDLLWICSFWLGNSGYHLTGERYEL